MKFLIFVLILLFLAKSSHLRHKAGQEKKDEDEPANPIIQFGLEKPYKDPIEARKIAEERKYERNRIKYMEKLEETDKKNFENILQNQDKLEERLSSLSENIKNLAFQDKSNIFSKAYPPTTNIDSLWIANKIDETRFKEYDDAIDQISEENKNRNDQEPPNGSFEAQNEDDLQNIMFKRKLSRKAYAAAK